VARAALHRGDSAGSERDSARPEAQQRDAVAAVVEHGLHALTHLDVVGIDTDDGCRDAGTVSSSTTAITCGVSSRNDGVVGCRATLNV